MKLIVCVDDRLGMAFNRRRQSSDKVLKERILALTEGKRLFMNPYSAGQFSGEPQIIVCEPLPGEAVPGDFIFAETFDVTPLEEQINEIILYKWNRHYPSDLHFQIPLDKPGWKQISTCEFAGSSHEKITEEVYRR